MNNEFPEMTIDDLIEVLGLTIKKDDANKVITFLCMLSAYTDDGQLNVSFNAPSSTGKSYIPIEVAKLFPNEDVLSLGITSPTAFFHDTGEFDVEAGAYRVNLERKIIIFIDQPHNELLERLRPILSHDQKTLVSKITDKTQKMGMKTKTVIVTGFPVVVFASAGTRIDEQEGTRFLLLSPEFDKEKLELSIKERLLKESDKRVYQEKISSNAQRQALISRILAIREAGMTEVVVPSSSPILKMFFEIRPILKPRHQRDIGRLMSIIKTFTLLNLWHRERLDGRLVASEQDITQAFTLLDSVLENQECGVPPYVLDFYKDCIEPFCTEKGLSFLAITTKHLEIYGRPLSKWTLRSSLLPLLESAGLIYMETSPDDHREKLVYCRSKLSIGEINSVGHGGVNENDQTYQDALDIFGGEPLTDD